MDETNLTEYKFCLKQAKTLAGKIWSSPFTRIDAEIIYRERWLLSISYCLPVTKFTDSQCDKIQSPFLTAILAKMEFNRHFSRNVVFRPKNFQGKQLCDLSVQQYLCHLERFVRYLRQETKIGDLLRIQMDEHQQVIGSQSHFLSLNSTDYPYAKPSRTQYLWERNTKYGITVEIDYT